MPKGNVTIATSQLHVEVEIGGRNQSFCTLGKTALTDNLAVYYF